MPSKHPRPDSRLISAIVAVADNGVIGLNNQLPWRLRADLRHFRRTTLGKPIIMGRKTFESLGKPLDGRLNIVLTRDPSFVADGALVVHAVDDALAAAGNAPEVVVIGGAQLYQLFWPVITRLYLTCVHATPAGDAFFPPLNPSEWQEQAASHFPADSENEFPFGFRLLERRHCG